MEREFCHCLDWELNAANDWGCKCSQQRISSKHVVPEHALGETNGGWELESDDVLEAGWR